MSYESRKLEQLAMPARQDVERALLRALLKHGGVIKEFAVGQKIVDEIANDFSLNEDQRSAFLQTVYRKENRIKKSLLWHRLLFRAADSLAKEQLVSRPTQTAKLTHKREWMLTEKGLDEVLKLSNITPEEKSSLPIKSYEVQKIAKVLTESQKPGNYNPIDRQKKTSKASVKAVLRARGFRMAVIEAYSCRCAFCGMKIASPDSSSWEVEAAHIIPNSFMGRDDVWNGLALCRFHHWAFDVGWLTLLDDYTIQVSSKVHSLPSDCGRLGDYEFLRVFTKKRLPIQLPSRRNVHPDHSAILWHRKNIFHQ